MQLIQILLPLHDNAACSFPAEYYIRIRQELTHRFGGLTAFTRAPAEGLWKDKGDISKDDIVVFEVMVQKVNKRWWKSYKTSLEELFQQEEIIIRTQVIALV